MAEEVLWTEEYLRGLRAALEAADEVGPGVVAAIATMRIREMIQAEEKRLAPIRRRRARDKAAMAPRQY
jgi:hypothetical protein